MGTPAAIIDFETRSVAELIGKHGVGAWVYSLHPTTGVLCLAYKLPGKKRKIWHPAFHAAGIAATNDPEDLFEWIREGGLVEAHNAFFERSIWKNVMRRKYKWPKVRHAQWRCTAARCAAMSLPRALEKVAIVLECKLKKDMTGNKAMKKCSKPRKLKKKERELLELAGEDPNQIFWHEDRADLLATFEYCGNDVDVEHEISELVPDLSDDELKVWQLDQKMNERGVFCDRKMVEAALSLTAQSIRALNGKLMALTGNPDLKASQRALIKKWLKDECGVDMPNMQGDTIDEYVADEETPKRARRALKLIKSANRTSTAKYVSMSLRMSPEDDRIRDTVMYHGSHTGRDCLPGETEVLTREGWVAIREWDDTKPIAQWSPLGRVQFLKARKKSFAFNGTLHHIFNKDLDLFCTDEHRIPTFYARGKWSKFEVVSGCEIRGVLDRRRFIPLSGNLIPASVECPLKTQLIVAFQADGSIKKDTRSAGTKDSYVFYLKKQRKILRLSYILNALGIKYSEGKTKYGHTTFYIANRDAPEWMPMSKTFGSYLLNHDPHIFIREVALWDGSRDKRLGNSLSCEYSTTVRENAEWVQTMAHLSGLTASISVRERKEKNWSTAYRVLISGGEKSGKTSLHPSTTKVVRSRKKTNEVFCAETNTGFFIIRSGGKICVTGNSGRGIQPQNFVRGYSKAEIMELACDTIASGSYEDLELLFGEPMDALAYSLRGALCAPKGRKLLSADFAAIEARVVLWMAGVKRALRLLGEGGDLYLAMAKTIYRREVTKEDFMERQMGKQAILGLGFGMGFPKFLLTLRKYKISFTKKQAKQIVGTQYAELEKWMRGQGKANVRRTKGLHLEQDMHELILCKYVVDLYREEYHQVVSLWDDMNDAAVKAVQNPGRVFEAGRVRWRCSKLKAGVFLQAMLPSGRKISYFDPRVSMKETPWGQKRPTLSFMGEDSQTRRWVRQYAHGGLLVENVVQGCARDLMKYSMLRIEETGKYECILPVHDEVVAEADEDVADEKEYSQLMSRTAPWAAGLPVSAGGFMCNRYMKG